MNVWQMKEDGWHSAALQQHAERTVLSDANGVRTVRLFDAVISGGTFRDYLSFIRDIQDSALFLDLGEYKFPLPCRNGNGSSESVQTDLIWQFSPDLCCEYAADGNQSMYLRDTAETLLKKVTLARQAQIKIILLSEPAYKTIKASSR